MWAGQWICEGVNWLLKRLVKQERPIGHIGNGYGFPSSHSQYMGYFATFLICHLHFRHRFETFGHPMLDAMWRICVYTALLAWAGTVCYSRFHLTYHTVPQIAWGVGTGVALGLMNYMICEFIPFNYPNSLLGQWKRMLLSSWISTSLRIRDGWSVWPDGGIAYASWRSRWEASYALSLKEVEPGLTIQKGKKDL